LDGASIHPVTRKIQVPFLTQLLERKHTAQGFHHEAHGDFKTVTEFNGCDRRTLLLLIHPQSEKNDVCRESNYSKT
jgi:hypothetical protein